MTIIFGYIHFLPGNLMFQQAILILISNILFIGANIFILRASKKFPDGIEKPKLLQKAAIINIIFISIQIFAPSMYAISPTPVERIIFLIYTIFTGLFYSVPFLISYGILFLKFGRINQDRFNRYLMISGLLWTIFFGFLIITLNNSLFSILSFFITVYGFLTSFIWGIISLFFISLHMGGFILLVVHGTKNMDKNLLVAGILGIVNRSFMILYWFFIPIIF
ncbi:MAG: hypothetical protein ACFFCY_15790 [Promethearchaeota archaeon]